LDTIGSPKARQGEICLTKPDGQVAPKLKRLTQRCLSCGAFVVSSDGRSKSSVRDDVGQQLHEPPELRFVVQRPGVGDFSPKEGQGELLYPLRLRRRTKERRGDSTTHGNELRRVTFARRRHAGRVAQEVCQLDA
jgi:hypothetical protein